MLWAHPHSHRSPESPESKFTTQGGNRNPHDPRKPKWLQLTVKTKPQWTPAPPLHNRPPHPRGLGAGTRHPSCRRTPSLHHAAQRSTGSRPRERERKEKVGRRGPRISVLNQATQGREGETLCPDKGPERNTFPFAHQLHATQHKTPQRQASRSHYPPSPTSRTTPTKRRQHSRRKYAAPT